jgi:hypothetical protein
MERLIDRLDHLSRFRLIKGLEHPGIREGNLFSMVSIRLEPADVPGFSEDGRDRPVATNIQCINGVYEVPENEWFQFIIKNNTEEHVCCVILDCTPEFEISVL